MSVVAIKNTNLLKLPWQYYSEYGYLQKTRQINWLNQNELVWNEEISGTSFRLFITYELIKPYYSARDRAGTEKEIGNERDETPMNHVCRDWITGFPFIKGSPWKNLFRRTYLKVFKKTYLLDRLFGTINETNHAEDQGEERNDLKGELKFRFSILDDKRNFESQSENAVDFSARLYTITPRKVEQGIADVVITYEIVPAGARAILIIDYIPRNPDIETSIEILKTLLTIAKEVERDAIGGKTSSDFGKLQLQREVLVLCGSSFTKESAKEVIDELSGESVESVKIKEDNPGKNMELLILMK